MKARSHDNIGNIMKDKSEQSVPVNSTNKGLISALPSKVDMHQYAWNVINFTTVAAATSMSIVAVQSPIKTVLLSLTKNGAVLPSYTGGALGLVRVMYAGTSASLSGSAARTVYVTGAKNGKPVEEISEPNKKQGTSGISGAKVGYVMSVTVGDIVVTQIPESLSQLRKINGLLPVDFNWKTPKNAKALMTGGFAPRFMSGMVNLSCLCLLEDEVSQRLPIANGKAKHFAAGAVSGMTAAFFTYPLTSFKDYVLVQAKVEKGILVNKSSFAVAKEMMQAVRNQPKQTMMSFFKGAVKQMPLRMGLTGAIFSIVSGVGETLGTEPLKNVVPERLQPSKATGGQGFFTPVKAIEAAPVEVKVSQESNSNIKPK